MNQNPEKPSTSTVRKSWLNGEDIVTEIWEHRPQPILHMINFTALDCTRIKGVLLVSDGNLVKEKGK